jgi:DNA-binding NtrC family response regulator
MKPFRKVHILIVDDDPDAASSERELLEDCGYKVMSAMSAEEARSLVERNFFDLLVLDEKMGGMSGTSFLAECRQRYPRIRAIFVTGWFQLETALLAMRAGALNFLQKPVTPKVFIDAVREAIELPQTVSSSRVEERLLSSLKSETTPVGNSPRWNETLADMRRVAKTNLPVLLLGETGTGKEVVARAIHDAGEAAAGSFVAVNLTAVSSLAEAQLFGYKKGAFTGAAENRPGLFEAADGGTILLDEIGDLSLDIQAKLLRVLQERKVMRLGDTVEIPIGTRIICATNRDLKSEVAKGTFREDLYFRISAFSIRLPALRERREDIPLLAEHLLERNRAEIKLPVGGISLEAMDVLKAYDWPGNIRELNNVIQRAIVLADGNRISPAHLRLEPPSLTVSLVPAWHDAPYREAKATFESLYFKSLLARSDGSRKRALQLSGMERTVLWDHLRKLGLIEGRTTPRESDEQ